MSEQSRRACFHLWPAMESSSGMYREQVSQPEKEHKVAPVPENSTGHMWATEAVNTAKQSLMGMFF